MDVFVRTFLPAAAETGVASPTVSRHLPILRRCVRAGDAAVLVARCVRPEQPTRGYLLLLTSRRLVVTEQTRVLQRLRLHLNTELRHLSNVAWTPDPRTSVFELAATAVDGVRERFLIRADRPSQLWQLDAMFNHVFRTKMTTRAARPAAPVTVPKVAPAVTPVAPIPAPALAPMPSPGAPVAVPAGRGVRAVPPRRPAPAAAPNGSGRAPKFSPALAG